jgi:hypothetical protein
VAKKLACWLGRHEWTTRVDEGGSYKVCAACGKWPRELGPPGQQGKPPGHEASGGGDFGGAAGGGDGG